MIEVRPKLEILPDGGNPSDDYVFRLERFPPGTTDKPPWPVGTLTFMVQPEGADGVGKSCKVGLGARITGCAGQGLVLASHHNGVMNWTTCVVEERPTWNETPLIRRAAAK